VTKKLKPHQGPQHLVNPRCCYHQQSKGLRISSGWFVLSNPFRLQSPKTLSQKANWRSFWPESTFWPCCRSASSGLLSELPCFALQPRRRGRQIYLAAPTRLYRIEAKIQAAAAFCCSDGARPHFTSDVLTCVIRNDRDKCSNAKEYCALLARRRRYGWTGQEPSSGFSDLTPSILHYNWF
jgi:hypothetical protein